MARDTEFVAIGIAEVGAIVVGVVLRPQPWQALALATVRENGLMSRTHTLSAFRHECNHLPISWIVGLTIVWLADYEERARTTFAVPTGPWLLWLAKPKFVSEALHQCVVERERSLEVADAHEDA